MRISIALGPFFTTPPGPAGAIERIWTDLACRFAALGHQVSIVCADHGGLPRKEQRDGVRILRTGGYTQSLRLPVSLAKDLLYSSRLCLLLPKADVTVVNSFWLPVLAPWLARRGGCIAFNVARMPKGQLRLYGGVDCLLAVSHAVRSAIAAQAPRLLERTVVIGNPINTDVFCLPERPRRYDGTKQILYTGRVHPEKGLDLLIEAFGLVHQHLPDTSLLIVGPQASDIGGGGDAYVRELRRKAGSLPVDIRPPVYDRTELRELMYSSHVYCYPSIADQGETFGVAPLEAMATGLPTVVSSLDCFRDFAQDGATACVFDHRAPNAKELLAEQLLAVLADSGQSQRIGLQAAQCAKRFSTGQIASEYLQQFETLLRGKATKV